MLGRRVEAIPAGLLDRAAKAEADPDVRAGIEELPVTADIDAPDIARRIVAVQRLAANPTTRAPTSGPSCSRAWSYWWCWSSRTGCSTSASGGPGRCGAPCHDGGDLAVRDLTVSFGAFRALDSLSLEIAYGEIRALIGPNGAGKTTLLDVVSGLTAPAPRYWTAARA